MALGCTFWWKRSRLAQPARVLSVNIPAEWNTRVKEGKAQSKRSLVIPLLSNPYEAQAGLVELVASRFFVHNIQQSTFAGYL